MTNLKSPSNVLIDAIESLTVAIKAFKIVLGASEINDGFVYRKNPLPTFYYPVCSLGENLPRHLMLTTVGDGTGNYVQNGDYSSTATDFYYKSPVGTAFDVESILITVSDNATFNQSDYGGIASGLTNGIKFFAVLPNNFEIQLMGSIAIKKNYEWLQLTPDVKLTTFAGTSQTLSIHLDMEAQFGAPLYIGPESKFVMRVNDDLTSLVSQTCSIQGLRYSS